MGTYSSEPIKPKQYNYNSSRQGILIRLAFNVFVFIITCFDLSPYTRHPATWALLIVNAVVFLQLRVNELSVYKLAVSPQVISNGEYYRIITSAFAHKELWHLILNMFSLYYMGIWAEQFLGTPYFILVYFQIIIGSGVICAIVRSKGKKNIGSIGASGAISGLLGFYISVRMATVGTSAIMTVIPTFLILLLVNASKKTDSLNHTTSFYIGVMLGILYLIHA